MAVLRSLSFAIGSLLLTSAPAFAQLDPLLFLKVRQPAQQPNVILAVETTTRMQSDVDGVYYDPGTYTTTPGGSPYEAAMGLTPGAARPYRRKFFDLRYLTTNPNNDKFSASRIEAVSSDDATLYSSFYERTRLALARRALMQAINDNIASATFALVKTRQLPTYPTFPAAGNESPVFISTGAQSLTGDVAAGRWRITRPVLTATNNSVAASGVIVPAVGGASNSVVRTALQRNFWEGSANALLGAGRDDANTQDTPVDALLADAKAEALRLIAADTTGCRNTIVVLVAGGGEGSANGNLENRAREFLNVSGRRVPIYVIALAPATADERQDLMDVAEESGGQYFEITHRMITHALDYNPAGPVPEMVRGVNLAVQHTMISSSLFDTPPTDALPYGPSEEFQVTSPIIGTVNLKGAQRYNPTSGSLEILPDNETEIYKPGGSTVIPQRSNVAVTTATELPGFYGQLRALRVYKPVPDSTRPSGYRFTQDGSRLWVASTPPTRNIYTILPGSGSMIAFDASNAGLLMPHLRVNDPDDLINWVRTQPLGAIIDSTPAFLDAPSLDPPPDADYPSFLEQHSERRALIFVGANDGMLHAIDARTGVEVWAFIPYNLLPKLRALRYGQSLDAFKYFVDSSPKIADVKVAGAWRTYLFFGQGPGGTFYNTLDVTLDDIQNTVPQTSSDTNALVNYFAVPNRIQWEWSFPRNTSFNPSLSYTASPYGDLGAGATAEEKSVGETWSDPAIGQIYSETGPFAMLVGSGYMRRSVETQANRGGARAGRAFYVLDVANGSLLASRDIGADSAGEDDDSCRAANDCMRVKNALQMDPVATGPSDLRFISKAYIGDLDGRVWRFDLALSGTTVTMATPVNLYSAGAANPLFASMATVNVGNTKQYIFVGSGSDLLPSTNVNHAYSLMVLLDNGASATKTAEILLERTDPTAPDEKVTAFPAVAGDIVFFSTTTVNSTTPCSPFTANLYAFTFIGGPAYDTNNDGRLTAGTSGGKKGGSTTTADSTKVFSQAGARATAPFIVDQHLVFATGGTLQMFGDPNDFNNGVGQAGLRILSWRMVK